MKGNQNGFLSSLYYINLRKNYDEIIYKPKLPLLSQD